MDKLTAYQILELENGASLEEIRDAYVELSKQYHPEEAPREFQRIHEAYTVLTNRRRQYRVERDIFVDRTKESTTFSEDDSIQKEDDYKNMQTSYDFDASIYKAEKEAEAQLQNQIMIAIEEVERLIFTDSNNHTVQKFEKFFERKEYQAAFHSELFIQVLIQYIEQVTLTVDIYYYMYKFYNFDFRSAREESAEKQKLYRLLYNRWTAISQKAKKRNDREITCALICIVVVFFGPSIISSINSFLHNEIDIIQSIKSSMPQLIGITLGCSLAWFIFQVIEESKKR